MPDHIDRRHNASKKDSAHRQHPHNNSSHASSSSHQLQQEQHLHHTRAESEVDSESHHLRKSPLSSHIPPNLFNSSVINSFKRPRTISPPTSTDENSSETETDLISVATPSSDTDSNPDRRAAIEGLAGVGGSSSSSSGTAHAIQHTPLRFSFGMSNCDEIARVEDPILENGKAAVDALLTEKMLNIATDSPDGSLPTYMNAIGQTTETTDLDMIVREDPPSLEEQIRIVIESNNQSLDLGQSWYLVEGDWYQSWKQSGSGKVVVGSLQTKGLLIEGSTMLKPGIAENSDFEYLSPESWKWLTSWYGLDGPSIERKVIQWPNTDLYRIELYPPLFKITCLGERSLAFEISLSVRQTLADLKTAVLERIAVSSKGNIADLDLDIRFWRLPLSSAEKVVEANSLQDAGVELIPEDTDTNLTLAEDQLDQPVENMIVEVKKKGASWHFNSDGKPTSSVKGIFKQDGGDFLSRMSSPSKGAIADGEVASGSSNTLGGRVTRSQTAIERSSEKQKGLTGLYNLGNTCFMNSALQCMSNTKELKDYFVSGVYKSEVNTSNPLGMGGAIAKVFGELLTKLWGSSGGAWHPREFKTVLSRFSPQFIGYAQQDTQELLAFLLDGLHEDLNRIVKKPYIEAPDWQGGGIKEMVAFAHKQWEIYKLRNDSVIVDLFQGQYRSTLVCPDCGKVSIKFDPFMYLTLPIPNRKMYIRKIIYIPWSKEEKPTEVEMRFTGETSFTDLKKKLAIWFDGDASKMVACDVFTKSFYRVYGDFENAADIGLSDVTFIYELPSKLQSMAPLPLSTQSYHRRDRVMDLEAKTKRKRIKDDVSKEDQYALLPVFSIAKASKFNTRYYSSRGNNGGPFGQPFFVAIGKDDMNNASAIQGTVMEKYMQYTSDPIALARYLNRGESKEQEGQNSLEDWDMLSDTPSSIVLPDLESEGTVAEIHNGGEDVHIVPDTSAFSNVTPVSSSLSSSKKGKGPSMHFVVHREDQTPLTLKPEGYEEYGEELYSRAARLADQHDESPMDTDQSSEELKSDDDVVSSKWPLVYTGGALVCVWPEKIKEAIFGDEDDEWAGGKSRPQFVDPELEAERNDATVAKKGKINLTIEDCLDEFTREEKLGESDPWYCPQCKDFKQATKKFDLWKVPDILVVHLKRFSSGRISRDKIDSFIDFPLYNLDLTNRVEGAKAVSQLHQDGSDDEALMQSIGSLGENDDAVESDAPIYDLYAVDNHYGGLGGGHYTSFAKNPEDEKWYYFDDSSVRAVNSPESEVRGQAAYLLFYRRRTTRPIGGKSREKVREMIENDKVDQDSYSDLANNNHNYDTQDQDLMSSGSNGRGGIDGNGNGTGWSDDGNRGGGGDDTMQDDWTIDNNVTYDASFSRPTQWPLGEDDDHTDTTSLSFPTQSLYSNSTGWEGLNLGRDGLDYRRRRSSSSCGSDAASIGDSNQDGDEGVIFTKVKDIKSNKSSEGEGQVEVENDLVKVDGTIPTATPSIIT